MSRRNRSAARAEEIRVPVPPLGTTWYDRGVAYWFRRAWFALLMLIGLVTLLILISGFVSAAWESRPVVGAVIASLIGVNGLVSGVWLWRRSTPKAIEERARTSGPPSAPRGTGVASGVLGVAALSGNMLALAVLVIGGSLMLGLVVVLVLRCLGRQLPQERALRALLNVPLPSRWR